jgi:hypothetical protein
VDVDVDVYMDVDVGVDVGARTERGGTGDAEVGRASLATKMEALPTRAGCVWWWHMPRTPVQIAGGQIGIKDMTDRACRGGKLTGGGGWADGAWLMT